MANIIALAKTVEKWKNGLVKCKKPNYTIETPFGKRKLFREADQLYVLKDDSKVFIVAGDTKEVKLDSLMNMLNDLQENKKDLKK